MIFDHCLLKKITNSLDFGNFRQISLNFGLSTWTHNYKSNTIKSSTVTFFYIFFCFLGFIICIPFFIREKINFLSNSCFSARNHEHLHNKTVDFFYINQFCTFCVFLCNDILLVQTTYRPGTFSVVLQPNDLISENMKISK